jgi:myosin-5
MIIFTRSWHITTSSIYQIIPQSLVLFLETD